MNIHSESYNRLVSLLDMEIISIEKNDTKSTTWLFKIGVASFSRVLLHDGTILWWENPYENACSHDNWPLRIHGAKEILLERYFQKLQEVQ